MEGCIARINNQEICGRDCFGNTAFCILHLPQANKDIELFNRTLTTLFEKSTKYYDLTRVIFPGGDWKIPIDEIDKPIYFNSCTFHSSVTFNQLFKKLADFRNSTFKSSVKFYRDKTLYQFEADLCLFDSIFHGPVRILASIKGSLRAFGTQFENSLELVETDICGQAEFDECSFSKEHGTKLTIAVNGDCSFEEAEFGETSLFSCYFNKGVTFEGTTFHAPVVFENTNFGTSTGDDSTSNFFDARFSEIVTFSLVSFYQDTSFLKCIFDKPEKTAFRNCDLSHARFNGCDISKVQFYLVSWFRQKLHLFGPNRDMVFDEAMLLNDNESTIKEFEATAQTYRRLQTNYGESYRYPEAGDFYIGEQEMVRQMRRKRKQTGLWITSTLYKWVASYGESYLRPLAWLVGILIIFPLLFGYNGAIKIPVDDQNQNFEVLNWDWSMKEFLLLTCDYWKAFLANLDCVTFRKATGSSYLVGTWPRFFIIGEFVLVATFLTFFLLALRRKFKRKSF